jgi:glycosyltransferase involved in cell wall biosynthesis
MLGSWSAKDARIAGCGSSVRVDNVLLEAMAVGLPVVVMAVGGAVDIIRDEENGLLVPPRDPQRLAAALLRLFDNPALAAKLGQAARATICDKYSIETVTKQHLALYNRLNREVHHDTTQVRLGFNSGV